MKIKEYVLSPFFLSLILGVLSWIIIFLITPASPILGLSVDALSYIALSYVAIILGYLVIPKRQVRIHYNNEQSKPLELLIVIVLSAFLFRYYDLFILRGASFKNSIWVNRKLIDSNPSGGIFILASLFRYLFFVPLIFLFKRKKQSKFLLVVCSFLFILPFIEGLVRGSRNSFFYPSIMFFLIILFYGKIKWKVQDVGLIIGTISILFLIATSILSKREISSDKDYEALVSDAIYTDFLKPKPFVKDYILKTQNRTQKKLLISGLQIGQYYTHGLFEFDNLMKTYSKHDTIHHQYGKYNFYNYVKLSNKIGLTDYNTDSIFSANPRGYSFITHFGGLYVDFGWFGLFFMFLLGVVQKWLYNQVKAEKLIFLPLFLFFIFMNLFMLTFNFLRNTGVSIITVNLILILIYKVLTHFSILKNT